MNPGMKMLAATSVRANRYENGSEGRSGGYQAREGGAQARYEYDARDYARNDYGRTQANYGGQEARFRDRTGREHYDNGRFAPVRNAYDAEMGMSPRNYEPPMRWSETTRNGGDRMNTIGFNMENRADEMNGNYRMSAGYPQMQEFDRMGGSKSSGYASGEEHRHMTRELAMEWTSRMQNEDGSSGPHWTLEQVKQIMVQKGVECDPLEFFVALNAMYSDYSKVFRKHGVGDKMDFYVDMAKAFMDDKDARKDKLTRYYEYVVKH